MAKNPHAVALGKRSGVNLTDEQRKARARKAGLAAAAKLTDEQRKARGKAAVTARWAGHTPTRPRKP